MADWSEMQDTNGKSTAWPRYHRDVAYSGLSSLNTLNICLPKPLEVTQHRSKIWLVYIHGGAWRDPAIDAASFDAAQAMLLDSPAAEHLNGIASINYRLSPYASHRTSPSNPSDPARNATHPDHINDVLTAIHFLQEKYAFDHRYLLVGHSCGATLALQVAMKQHWGHESTSSSVIPPLAIAGVEGIYDLPKLVEQYAHEPVYEDFVTGAFGSDRSHWAAASPSNAEFTKTWPDGRIVYLIHSLDDELVDIVQPAIMFDALLAQSWDERGPRRVVQKYLSGLKHDEVWLKPADLVATLNVCIEETVVLLH